MTSGLLADIAWERLRGSTNDDESSGLPSLELPVATHAGQIRLSMGPGGEARILIPILSGEAFPNIGDGPSLLLKDSVLLIRGVPVRFIDITCRHSELEQVFREVVTEILGRIGAGEVPGAAVEGAVNDFRSLLRARRQDITVESVIGLLGELVILNQLLDENPDGWKMWNGPRRGRHDFRAGPQAIEVKTSLRAQQRVVEITSLDQLAEPNGGLLHLACFFIEHDPHGELHVPELAKQAISKASDTTALRALLSACGYDPDDSKSWSEFRFTLLSFEMYRVVDGFPRLTPKNFREAVLPPGVSHFRYRIDLSAATDFRLESAAAVSVVKELSLCPVP